MSIDIGFEASLQGKGFGDDDWKREANLWSITLTHDGRKHRLDFWMGPGNLTYEPVFRSKLSQHQAEREGRIKYNHFGPGKDAITSPRPPERNEVLANLALDCSGADQAFEDFAADFGYDEDSRSAYATYEACRKQMFDLRKFFGADYDEFVKTEWEDLDEEG